MAASKINIFIYLINFKRILKIEFLNFNIYFRIYKNIKKSSILFKIIDIYLYFNIVIIIKILKEENIS